MDKKVIFAINGLYGACLRIISWALSFRASFRNQWPAAEYGCDFEVQGQQRQCKHTATCTLTGAVAKITSIEVELDNWKLNAKRVAEKLLVTTYYLCDGTSIHSVTNFIVRSLSLPNPDLFVKLEAKPGSPIAGARVSPQHHRAAAREALC